MTYADVDDGCIITRTATYRSPSALLMHPHRRAITQPLVGHACFLSHHWLRSSFVPRSFRAQPLARLTRQRLAMHLGLQFHQEWVERSWCRLREIAAVDLAQRILLGTSRLWMRWARDLLSMHRRDLALIDWAEERGLVLYETSSSEDL